MEVRASRSKRRSKVSMVTPIEMKQETFRSRFEGERKDGGKGEWEQAKEFRRVLLVFVVKSQRKLRLRRNEKRFDQDSKENTKEELIEA
ncbi:hypothetical protein DY000_02022377 [Brassica cretica]|uniref:Uncharacterized protein n=2 Tax=Brassica cretica TaxID=69181 RepID=A0ABQ7EFR9_BRACR|nr:hypothetical protein DY000_02022377 [Brassica cretica]